jgi:hypothetical protein
MFRLNKILFVLYSISIFLIACQTIQSQQIEARPFDKEDLHVEEINLALAISKIANHYKSPVGFEYATAGKESIKIKVDLFGKTFEDALKAAIS